MCRRGVLVLSAAVVLAGAAQILVMPPFEGFDETAHYSYVREIADTHAIPVFGRSTIASVVTDYRQSGPMPYTSVPPFDDNGGWTYQTFFAHPVLHDVYRRRYRTSEPENRRYKPTSELNWEAQHPPLYYALLAPLLRATDRALSFNAQLLLLRLVSFLFAVGGLLIGLHASARLAKGPLTGRALIAGALLYPFLVPMFFPEFGRVGNDSLCMFLVGLTWAILLHVVEEPASRRPLIALGIVLGLGLLTKAFFLPIGTGLCAYLSYRAWAVRSDRSRAALLFRDAAIVAGVATLTGGWWYIYKFLAFNSITGGAELINLDARGGLLPNLQQKFAIGYFIRGFVALFASAYYTGTWSLARVPEVLYLPGVLLIALIAFYCLRELRHVPFSAPWWAPVWISLPVIGGFMYFILARIALEGSGNNIAGWYLNVLAPAVALLVGLGLEHALAVAWIRRILGVLAAYAVFFFIAGQWAQTALYSGCAIKPATTKYYVFSDGWFCLTRLPQMNRNLSVTGWPVAAAICFVTALLCLAIGARTILRPEALKPGVSKA